MDRKAENLILCSLLGSFAALSALTLFGDVEKVNRPMIDKIQGLESPAMTQWMKYASSAGEWFSYVPTTAMFLLMPRARQKLGIPVAATLGVSALTNMLLKRFFAVARPDSHRLTNVNGYSFPSGHAMNGTAFIGTCTLLFMRHRYKRELKVAALSSASLFLLAVGFSRVYLGVHNPTDVFAGYAMGASMCILAARHIEKPC